MYVVAAEACIVLRFDITLPVALLSMPRSLCGDKAPLTSHPGNAGLKEWPFSQIAGESGRRPDSGSHDAAKAGNDSHSAWRTYRSSTRLSELPYVSSCYSWPSRPHPPYAIIHPIHGSSPKHFQMSCWLGNHACHHDADYNGTAEKCKAKFLINNCHIMT